MARNKRRRKTAEEEHTSLALRVKQYDASVDASVNCQVYNPEYATDLDEQDPLYRFRKHLEIIATSTYPDERAGDTYTVTIYGHDAPSSKINDTLKTARALDENYAPVYRSYRGKQVPVFHAPAGLRLLDKVRGEPRWTAWLEASPRFLTDAIILLGQPLYLAIHERKRWRTRWVQSISLQTTDSAEE